MKILIFSDLHLGNHKKVSEQGGLNVLKYILDYAQNTVGEIKFAGDLFDKGETLTPSLVRKVTKILSKTEIPIYFLPGQHDAEDFEGNSTAIDVIEYLYPDNLYAIKKIGYTPFLIHAQHDRNIERLQQNLLNVKQEGETFNQIFMGHFLVDELLEASGMSDRIKGDVNFEKHLKHLSCDHYFIGDYHKHIHISELNLTSIGTCCPTSFKDEGCKASFLIYDTETKEFEREYIPDAPYFIKPSYNDMMKGTLIKELKQNKNIFIEMKVKSEKEKEKLVKKTEGLLNIEIFVEDEENKTEQRLDIDWDVQPLEVIKKYCEFMGVNEEFIKKGLEYL